MGKIEVALACKAGCDYMVAQLPIEHRELPRRLQYPPNIADYIDLFANVEKAGGGYNVGEGEGEDEQEAVSGQSTNDSTRGVEKDVGADSAEKERDGTIYEVPSTPPPSSNASLPLTPEADLDFL